MNSATDSIQVLNHGLDRLTANATKASQSILRDVSSVRKRTELLAKLASDFSSISKGQPPEKGGGNTESQLLSAFGSLPNHISMIATATGQIDNGAFLEALRTFDKVLIEAWMVSVLLKIDAAKQSSENSSVGNFAQRFSDLFLRLQAEIHRAKAKGGQEKKQIIEAKDAIAAALEQSVSHASVIQQEFRLTEPLLHKRNAAFEKINQATSSVTDNCNASIQVLLPSMQFADAFSQRCGNAQKILNKSQDLGPKEMALARWLVAEQLRALAKDSDTSRRRSDAALDAIYAAAFRCQQILTGKGDLLSAARDWLDRKSRATLVAEQSCVALSAVLSNTFELIDVALDQSEVLSAQILIFDELAQGMAVEAANGWISSARIDRASPGPVATKFLAAEVKTLDSTLSALLSKCAQSLSVTKAAIASIDRQDITQTLQSILDLKSAILADITAHNVTRDALEKLSSDITQVLQDLVASCKEAREIGRTMGQFTLDLQGLIGAIGGHPVDILGGCDMEWAWQIYTTTEERLVHETLFGKRTAPPTPDTAAEDDFDLADFMM